MTCPFAPFAGAMAKYGYELALRSEHGNKVFVHSSGNVEIRRMPLNANPHPRTRDWCVWHRVRGQYLPSPHSALRRFGKPTAAALAALEAWGQP